MAAQNWHFITLFPEFFTSPLAWGLLKKALDKGLLRISFVNPRSFSPPPHHHVDDRPYGGGAGMVMQLDPLVKALQSLEKPGKIILATPRGRPFGQKMAAQLAKEENITVICGRYEGIDERLGELFELENICIGPYVLNGGETAALAILEACARLLPGFMGKSESASEESFNLGLLEYPQYTRPEVYANKCVPEELLSGHHAQIAAWRRKMALAATLRFNPALLADAPLDRNDVNYLRETVPESTAANFSFCLMHYPVLLEQGKIGASSLTNLDIHDIARISRSYDMGPFYVATPLREQQQLLAEILVHWTRGAGGRANPHRKKALDLVCSVESLAQAREQAQKNLGLIPYVAASSAMWPDKKHREKLIGIKEAREIIAAGPFILCLGTARGLAPQIMDECDGILRPIRFPGENHLSVRAAAAILADRIFGDFG